MSPHEEGRRPVRESKEGKVKTITREEAEWIDELRRIYPENPKIADTFQEVMEEPKKEGYVDSREADHSMQS